MEGKTELELHSFVICAYGESPYLESCIRSLLAQTVKSEILIATSTPGPYISALAEKYRIPVCVNDGPAGIGGDWNFALSCSGRPFVTLAHQDDIYDPQYALQAIRHLQAASQPLIYFSGYRELRNDRQIASSRLLSIKKLLLLPLRVRPFQASRFVRRRVLSLGNPICCPAVTYCMTNLPQPLFTSPMKSNLDWAAWERLSRLPGAFVYQPDSLMCHRIHEASTTSQIIAENTRSEEDYAIFRLFWPKWFARFLTRRYRTSESSNQL